MIRREDLVTIEVSSIPGIVMLAMNDVMNVTYGRPVALWIPSWQWMEDRLGVNVSGPPMTIWGIPVKVLPPPVELLLCQHTTYDRFWLEMPDGSWFEAVAREH